MSRADRDGFVRWDLCPDCGKIVGITGQRIRKRLVGLPRHGCLAVPENRDAICLVCLSLKHPRTQKCYGYRFIEPHPTTCRQCGVVFIAKWRQLCPACSSSNKREQRKSLRRKRRMRVAAARELYRVTDVFARDGWRCHLCGRATKRDAKVPHPRAPTIDHLVPLSAGGGDTPLNVATAHFECNWRRADGGAAQLRLVA